MFYVTREPIPIEMFKAESETADNTQTVYIDKILDGSDDLIPGTFLPEEGQATVAADGSPIVPTLVELNFFYYQKTRDIKLIAKVEVFLKEYKPYTAGADPVYRLRLTYQALSYFALLNTFQFDMPIYVVLFTFVSLVLVLGIIVFWLVNLQFSTFKRPPNLRFMHLARVTFAPPATGAVLASVPALLAAVGLAAVRGAQLFSDVSADWTEGEVTAAGSITQARGRLGLVLIVLAVTFLQHGAEAITSQPSEEE